MAALDAWPSGRHHKALPVDFLVEPCRFAKRLLVAQRGITNPSQLVGQRTGRLVVIASGLHIQRPAAYAANLTPGVVCHLGGTQHAAGAVGEQHAQVAAVARAVLLGRQAKPAGKVPGILEVADIA